MAVRRNFIVELDDMMKQRALIALLKRPADPNALLQEAGHTQGLNTALNLFKEIVKQNNQED